jgi:mRNA interferase HigB
LANEFQGRAAMRVISRKRLREFWERHPKAKAPLEEWYRVTRKAKWKKFADVRAVYPSADAVNQFVVFNIRGNNFRLIGFLDYEYEILFVRFVLTHKEYEKGKWKKDKFGTNPQPRSKKSDAG